MGSYLKKARQLINVFQVVEVKQISRTENYRVGILTRMAVTTDAKMPRSIRVEVKASLSIE